MSFLYKINRFRTGCLCLLVALSIQQVGNIEARTVTIFGTAIDYANDSLIIKYVCDYITGKKVVLNRFGIDNSGFFKTTFNLEETIETQIDMGVNIGILFLEPGKNYEIILPAKQEKTQAEILNPYFSPTMIYLGIVSDDLNELNYNIKMFDYLYDTRLCDRTHLLFLTLKRNKKALDSLIQNVDSLFRGVDNDFFNDYRYYKYALLYYLGNQRDVNYAVRYFLSGHPIRYNNPAYMEFFNQMFSEYFSYYALSKDGERLVTDITEAKSYQDVMETLGRNIAISGDTLKELVFLKGLHDAFYTSKSTHPVTFPKAQLHQTLDSLELLTAIPQHKKIARQIRDKVNRLLPGTKAPEFHLKNLDDVYVNSRNFSGRYIYLSFFSIHSFTCREDLMKLVEIQNKMDEDIVFVTIVIDDDQAKVEEFFRKTFAPWTILICPTRSDLPEQYRVSVYPSYFLIDPDGKLRLSPAPSPGENFDKAYSDNKR